MGSEVNLTMYEDAWPDTAPMQTFIKERKCPQQVLVAMVSLLVVGGGALLAGLLHLATESGTAALSGIPGVVTAVFGLAVAAWAGILARPVVQGSKWSHRTAQWTAGAGAALFALYGLLALPQEFDFVGSVETIFAFIAAAAGLTGVVCLLGRTVRDYFDPQVEPVHFDPSSGQISTGGRDADWIPPEQRQRSRDDGFLS